MYAQKSTFKRGSVLLTTNVDLNDWDARAASLNAIRPPLYYDHEWRYALPEDPFPEAPGVRVPNAKKRHDLIDYDMLVRSKPIPHLLFGEANEIEYSANVIFDGDKLKLPDADAEAYVYSGWREYYTAESKFYYDNHHITRNGPTLDESLVLRSVLRADRRSEDPSIEPSLSAKLKLYRRNMCVAGRYKISLSGSIEVPYTHQSVKLPRHYDSPTRVWILPGGNKSLLTRYWGVSFTLADGTKVLMRVSFRQPAALRYERDRIVPIRVRGSNTKCNIECESYVCGELFVRLLRILYLYYRHQFVRYDGLVLPYRFDCTPDSIDDLDSEERELASTYSHVDWRVCSEEEKADKIPTQSVCAFVRYLGLESFADYYPRGEINYSSDDESIAAPTVDES